MPRPASAIPLVHPTCIPDNERVRLLLLDRPELEKVFDARRWPARPYVSHDKSRVDVLPLVEALQCAYIQPDPPGCFAGFTIDVDLKEAAKRWRELNLLEPTWITTNPVTTHAQYRYGLRIPVSKKAHRAALKFMQDVARYLRILLGGDPNYRGHLTQNPIHPKWITEWSGVLYDLEDFVSLRKHPAYGKLAEEEEKRAAERQAGNFSAGRNCAGFNELRLWARDHISEYYAPNSRAREMWAAACQTQIQVINPVNKEGHPLPPAELRSIARSVARWTWDKFNDRAEYVARTHTPEMQSRRGKKSGRARSRKSAVITVRVLELHEMGLSATKIAYVLKVSVRTVWRALKRGKDMADHGNDQLF